jgi:hypothetical protein
MDDRVFKEDVSAWEGRCKSMCRGIQLCTCGLFGGGAVAEDLEAGVCLSDCCEVD